VLSRRNLSYPSRRSRPNSRPVNLLQPLCSLFAAPVLCFQQLAASFSKTPGVGVPLRDGRYTEAQKCPSVSPLPATLTHSVSRKSFPCHSYANTRDGGVTPPAKFFSLLVYPERLLRRATRHSPLALTPFRINTCKSVSKQATLTPFRINTYEKRGGRGVPVFSASPASSLQASSLQNLMRHVAPLSPVPSFDCAYFPSPRGCTIQSTEMAVALRGRPQRA